MSEDFSEILHRLISFPLRSQIKIDFDLKKKIFCLSIPIFYSQTGLPDSVKEYVEARKKHTFKPHKTSFQFEGTQKVLLVQTIEFSFSSQLGFRQEIDEFWKMAKRCHQMLSELSVEEKLK